MKKEAQENQHQDKRVYIEKAILKIVRETNVQSVSDVLSLVQTELPVDEDELVQHVLKLKKEGKLVLKDQSATTYVSTVQRLLSPSQRWYWIVTLFNFAGVALILTIQETWFPAVYARYFAGSLFFLVLPGYSMTKVLFRSKELDFAQRVAIGLSSNIALVGLVAFILNLTPYGVRTFPITLCLAGLTCIFSTAAFIRENFQIQRA